MFKSLGFIQTNYFDHKPSTEKHWTTWPINAIAVTPNADNFLYKTESCSKNMFHKKVLQPFETEARLNVI